MHTQTSSIHFLSPYSFNGMEKDDEVKGEGNSYDFGARMLDARVGRWLSLDAMASKYSEFSPYCFTLNNPIMLIDSDGNEVVLPESEIGANLTVAGVKRNIHGNLRALGIKWKPQLKKSQDDKIIEFSSKLSFYRAKIYAKLHYNSENATERELATVFRALTSSDKKDEMVMPFDESKYNLAVEKYKLTEANKLYKKEISDEIARQAATMNPNVEVPVEKSPEKKSEIEIDKSEHSSSELENTKNELGKPSTSKSTGHNLDNKGMSRGARREARKASKKD